MILECYSQNHIGYTRYAIYQFSTHNHNHAGSSDTKIMSKQNQLYPVLHLSMEEQHSITKSTKYIVKLNNDVG